MLTYPKVRRLGRHISPEASMILNFAERRAMVAGKPVNLQSLITFDRAGTAWGLTDGGVMRNHAANEMRLERLGTGQGGLLMERATTNLFRYCRDLSNAAWTKSSATVAQTATGIDGEESVSLCTDTALAGAARGKWSQSVAVPATNQWITVSIYVRQIIGTKIRLYTGLAGGSSAKGGFATFDTEIGAVLSAESGIIARVEPAAMGFMRLVMSVSNTVGGTACVLEISRESDAESPIVFAADFAQMEYGSRASSPIYTTAASVGRASERARIVPVNDWFNPYEGTLYLDAMVRGAAEYDRSLIRFAGAGGSLEVSIGGTTGGVSVLSIIGGSVQASNNAAGYVNPPRRLRIAVRYKANDFAFSVAGVQTPYDGESLGTPRVIALPGATDVPIYSSLEIGAVVGTLQMDGLVRQVIYIPFALDDERLAAAVL